MKLNILSKTLVPLSVVSVGLVVSASQQAQAVTLGPFTASTGFEVTDLENIPLDNPLLIPQFDPMANMTATQNAVLTSVTVSYFGAIESGGTITSQAAGLNDFTVTVSGNASITGPVPGSSVDFAFPGSGGISSLNVALNADDVAQNETADLPTTTGATTTTVPVNPITLTSAADLAAFIGTGDVTFLGNTEVAQTIQGGGGNATTALTTLVDLAVTVEYEFDLVDKESASVPEPASLLGLLAVGGIGFVTRRRKS